MPGAAAIEHDNVSRPVTVRNRRPASADFSIYSSAGFAAEFSDCVAFAAWLEEMALRDEARKYWQAAAGERPDDPRLKVMAGE